MVNPDAVETSAPAGSFELVTSIFDDFQGRLGNSRTRRQVWANPIWPQDLSPEGSQAEYKRPGLYQVWDELSIIRAAQPRPGEKFIVVRLLDWPLNGDASDSTFTISDQLRVIGLRTVDPGKYVSSSQREQQLPPRPLEEIFREIKTAIRLQPKLKIPTGE